MIDLRYGNDAIDVLREMPAESVHVCVTSPPYFGLRDYGTGSWAGGDAACSHKASNGQRIAESVASVNGGGHSAAESGPTPFKASCQKCGAARIDQQIGLESTVQEFIAKLIAVFAEVHRVLHPSGTLWVNIGDSYAGHNAPGFRQGNEAKNGGASNKNGVGFIQGLKPKDLMMVPSRFAIAMQDWGWYLRDFIVWAKPAPMPESVTDRCTKAWEPIFMFAKSPRYYADMTAVAEPSVTSDERRPYGSEGAWLMDGRPKEDRPNGKPRGKGGKTAFRGQGHEREAETGPANRDGRDMQDVGAGLTRNLRNVWTLPPESFPGKHFATFPSELPRKCILIGSSAKGCCPHCLAPWVRVTESERKPTRSGKSSKVYVDPNGSPYEQHCGSVVGNRDPFRHCTETTTVGWAASCQCHHAEPDTIPCRVLDPFSGSGTTGRVAFDLGRDYIGIDLNKEYEPLARERIGGLFIGGDSK